MSTWRQDFKLREDLVQRDVSAFELVFVSLPGSGMRLKLSIRFHAALCAAIAAGWIESPKCEVLTDKNGDKRYMFDGVNVEDMHAGKVTWYGEQVEAVYEAATTPPKN